MNLGRRHKQIKEFLIGTLLGDAHIGRTGLNKAFISFEQSSKKREYLNYLLNITKEGEIPLMDENIREYLREDPRYKTTNRSLYFRTQSIEELKPMADLFLDTEGKKIIPQNIADHLTARSLAFWIMDDGQQVKRGGVTLCTDSYSTGEINILRFALRKNFNLGRRHKQLFIIKRVQMMQFMKESILKRMNWKTLSLL